MGTVQWDRDDRDPSLWTRLYVRAMWLRRDKQAFQGEAHTERTARSRQRDGDRPPTSWTRLRFRCARGSSAGVTTWTITPRSRRPAVRVVYLHGGGYVHPLTVDYWRLVRALAGVPAEVVVPLYPLAPDHTVDDVLPRLLEIVDGGQEPPTVVMGDSAGGALAIVIAQQLRDRGSRSLLAVVALCPWLDATLDERSVASLEATDPMLDESGLRAAGRWWAGSRSPADAVVSPLAADLDGLPPLDVFIGDHDVLRPAVDDLAERAEAQGADLHVHEVSAMFHVWMTRALPEAARTRHDLRRLLRRRVDA